MKRKVYRIVCFADNGRIEESRYSWNAALAAIPEIIRANFCGRWTETITRWEKHQRHHVGGASQWVDGNGNKLNFSIYTS
jgi:hypothetical protein